MFVPGFVGLDVLHLAKHKVPVPGGEVEGGLLDLLREPPRPPQLLAELQSRERVLAGLRHHLAGADAGIATSLTGSSPVSPSFGLPKPWPSMSILNTVSMRPLPIHLLM